MILNFNHRECKNMMSEMFAERKQRKQLKMSIQFTVDLDAEDDDEFKYARLKKYQWLIEQFHLYRSARLRKSTYSIRSCAY